MADDTNTTTEVEVKVKTRDQESGQMVEVLSTSTKFIKSDGNKSEGETRDEYIYITIKPGSQPNYGDAVISITSDTKQSKGKN